MHDPAQIARLAEGLTFRPFAMLPRVELLQEARYWRHLARVGQTSAATVAARHYRRCRAHLTAAQEKK